MVGTRLCHTPSRAPLARRIGYPGLNQGLVLFLLVAFVAAVAAPTASWAQTAAKEAVIGVVKLVKGRVDAARAGDVVLLKKEDPIHQGDTLQTGIGGKLGVVFTDGSTFNMDENSMMTIDEMVYDPAQGTGRIALNAVRGLFAFASGAITRNTAEGMTIRTPVMNIGIRGTVKNVSAAPVGELNTAAAQSGSARVFNTADSQVINAGQKAETDSPTNPITVSSVTPADQQRFQGVREANKEIEEFGETGQIENQLKQQLQGTPEGAVLDRLLAELDQLESAGKAVMDGGPTATPGARDALQQSVDRAGADMKALEDSAAVQNLVNQNPAVGTYLQGLRSVIINNSLLLAPGDTGGAGPGALPPFRPDGQSTALLHDMRNIAGYNPTTLDPTGIVPSDAGVELPFCVSQSGSGYYFVINDDGTLDAGSSITGNHTFACFDLGGSSGYCSCSSSCSFNQTSSSGSTVVTGTFTTSVGTFDASGQMIGSQGCVTDWEQIN
ncbi:exported protein of unknown function [Magnetospira sp. QH-2]|nr:exported protein of unknown function [Magnetospira sp. QH-2]